MRCWVCRRTAGLTAVARLAEPGKSFVNTGLSQWYSLSLVSELQHLLPAPSHHLSTAFHCVPAVCPNVARIESMLAAHHFFGHS